MIGQYDNTTLSNHKNLLITLRKRFAQLPDHKYLSLLLFFLYLLFSLYIGLSFHKVGNYGVETDFFWSYVPQAKEFIKLQIPIDDFRGPLYPLILSFLTIIIKNYFTIGIIISSFTASLVVYTSHKLFKKLTNNTFALFSVLLIISNKFFIYQSYLCSTDMLFFALSIASVYKFISTDEIEYRNLIYSGILAGLAYLTRYIGFFIIIIPPLIIFLKSIRATIKLKIKFSFIYFISFFITISPWSIYTLIKKGSFFYNLNYKNILYGLYGTNWENFWSNEGSSLNSLYDIIKINPTLFLINILKNIGFHWWVDMNSLLGIFIGVFFIVGLFTFLFFKKLVKYSWNLKVFLILNLIYFLILTTIFYSERFSLPLLPFYIFFVVLGLNFIKTQLTKYSLSKISTIILVSLLFLTTLSSYFYNNKNVNSGPRELLSLREWFDRNIPKTERGFKICARKPHIAYYLNLKFVPFPNVSNYSDLIKFLKENKVDYLYYSTYEALTRNSVYYLLEPQTNRPYLKIVVHSDYPKAVLYRVLN